MGLFTLGDAGPGVGTEINTQMMMPPVIIVTGHWGLSRHNLGWWVGGDDAKGKAEKLVDSVICRM